MDNGPQLAALARTFDFNRRVILALGIGTLKRLSVNGLICFSGKIFFYRLTIDQSTAFTFEKSHSSVSGFSPTKSKKVGFFSTSFSFLFNPQDNPNGVGKVFVFFFAR